jgi:threonyl-tRNA synthetase
VEDICIGVDGSGESIYYNNTKESLEIIRHSTAHLMAQAIKQLYREAKFFVGPVIRDGFYYDFKVDSPISDKELKKIEKTMKKLINKDQPLQKYYLTKDEAREKFANDHLKQAVIDGIKDDRLSIYKQGDFEDLCRGPHVPNTNLLKHFKLTKVSGAYLGGDQSNEMLTRIYGIAFATKEALEDYLFMVEEAKKRDHRKLGAQLRLFTFDESIGAGLPLWLPNGARLRAKLEALLYKAHRVRGYEPVRAPEILKSEAWRISGHYDNYGENMYFTSIDEGDESKKKIVEYGIKPMNCVGHIKIYQSEPRSYKDLPLKFFEYGVVHRHELSGALHGLFRVREFTQDDAHIYCMPTQIKENVLEVLDFVRDIMNSFGFEYNLMVSTRPKKAIGSEEIWNEAIDGLKSALDESGIDYGIDEGGGAFYGPKIDIKINDSLKREWQCGTIQVDFNLPERFLLEYNNEHNTTSRPVMIHRAILGSFERFIGILTEHCAGEFPFFLAPTQVVIIPILDSHMEYVNRLKNRLVDMDIDVYVSNSSDSLNKKIRVAEKQKVPMIVVIGDQEVEYGRVALRDRRERKQLDLTQEEFYKLLKERLNEVHF